MSQQINSGTKQFDDDAELNGDDDHSLVPVFTSEISRKYTFIFITVPKK